MNIGMLWFDNDPKTDLSAKVQQAASFYKDKYGVRPNVCFVHPSMIPEDRLKTGRVEVRKNGSVLPNHYWIGVNGSDDQG
jgi:hypothetical protein